MKTSIGVHRRCTLTSNDSMLLRVIASRSFTLEVALTSERQPAPSNSASTTGSPIGITSILSIDRMILFAIRQPPVKFYFQQVIYCLTFADENTGIARLVSYTF